MPKKSLDKREVEFIFSQLVEADEHLRRAKKKFDLAMKLFGLEMQRCSEKSPSRNFKL